LTTLSILLTAEKVRMNIIEAVMSSHHKTGDRLRWKSEVTLAPPVLCVGAFHAAIVGLTAFAATYNLGKAVYHGGNHGAAVDLPSHLGVADKAEQSVLELLEHRSAAPIS
jgi:hypothetical protein